ncbi:MAG: hypothetical protein GY703_13770 [Gammaproteobacteria bacterium]|nr:hypothetical protein [Gammaproteobacteria bacterium]
MAEFRRDGRIFGIITHLFDIHAPYHHAPEYGEHAFDPQTNRYYSVVKEFRKKKPAFAYSNRTREYLRRRSWRTLKRLGVLNSEQYIDLAVEMLLAVNDADARSEQVIEFYDYKLEKLVSRTCDRYGHLFAFNHILNAHNPRIKLSGSGKLWLIDTAVAEVGAFRSEAYPGLWYQAPQALFRLLTESRCDAVHRFAVPALKSNQEFVCTIDGEAASVMLSMPYESTALFALDIARNLIRSGSTNIRLIRALFLCRFRAARELAQETMRLHPLLLTDDVDLAYAVITSTHEDKYGISLPTTLGR